MLFVKNEDPYVFLDISTLFKAFHHCVRIVIHVTKGACLSAVPEDRDALMSQSSFYKSRQHKVFALVGTVGVEKTKNRVGHPVLCVVRPKIGLA